MSDLHILIWLGIVIGGIMYGLGFYSGALYYMWTDQRCHQAQYHARLERARQRSQGE